MQVAETHSGMVFAVGDLVYEAKKPVDLGFLDFSSVEQRRSVCHREVELNRRLAADVYLGVADVTGPDGQVCEHAGLTWFAVPLAGAGLTRGDARCSLGHHHPVSGHRHRNRTYDELNQP